MAVVKGGSSYVMMMVFLGLAFSLLVSGNESLKGVQSYPHIVEYIDNFELSSNDIKQLTISQFKQITLPDLATTSFELTNSQVSLSYIGSRRNVVKISPLKVKVENDTYGIVVQFHLKVLHLANSKNYTCTVKAPQIVVNYTKEVDYDSGNTLITNLASSYSSSSFQTAECKQSATKNDQNVISDAVSSTKNSSIYLQLKKTLDRMQDYLSINAKEERLSRVYDQNPYSYDYYGFKIDINVGTLEATPLSDTSIENQISGVIDGSSYPAIEPPPFQQGFSTFYSFQFIKGIIEYSVKNYAGWREIKLNRGNMRTRTFNWRLIDFEYLVPAVLEAYPQFYMADVDLRCGAERLGDMELGEKNMEVSMGWRCMAGFQGNQERVTFMNFFVPFKHTVTFEASGQTLAVRVSALELLGLEFDYIGDFKVEDPFTLAQFIKEGLFEFATFTIGTYFKIGNAKTKVKLIPSRGLWIG